MTVMTFKEYVELDEIAPAVVTGAKYTIALGVRIGKEIIKLAAPPLSIKDVVKGTVIYSIAKKYDLTAIIKLQSWGIGLIIDVGKWVGIGITPDDAARIFGRLVASGVITLGAILLSVIAVKNPKKAKSIYNKAIKASKNVKSKLTGNDIKNIRKELKAA